MHRIKAIIPAAGLGIRLLPFTLAVPKEFLPVNRKPLIQWAVEEAVSAGIREIGVVIRKGKGLIRDYLETLMVSDRFLHGLKGNGRHGEATLHFIYQERPMGLGNALYEAGDFLHDHPFVMILPDQFLLSEVSATGQLMGAAAENPQAVWNTLVSVPESKRPLFPGARTFELGKRHGNVWEVKGFREPSISSNGETLLAFGRTFFPGGALNFFSDKFLNPATGEVDLLPSYEALMREYTNFAFKMKGRPLDFGTWEGYEYFFPRTRSLSNFREEGGRENPEIENGRI